MNIILNITDIQTFIPKFERRKESKNLRERKKVKRRVRIVKNIDNIDNNTMIEWMWICWGKNIFKCIH